jgi:hypothetical protein
MNSASLFSLAGRYDSPIPTRLLVPIDCLKIPAQPCLGERHEGCGPERCMMTRGKARSGFSLSWLMADLKSDGGES